MSTEAVRKLVDIQNLLHTCWLTLVETNGAVVLADALPETGLALHSFSDRTDAEAFYNHIHILDILTIRIPPAQARTAETRALVRDIAHLITDMWCTKLQRDFPAYHFRVYLITEEQPILRFHVVRSDEAPWLNLADWQSQLTGGTLAIYDITGSVQSHPSP